MTMAVTVFALIVSAAGVGLGLVLWAVWYVLNGKPQ